MITALILDTLVEIVNLIFGTLGDPITELPLGMDNFIVSGIGYVNSFKVIFPPFDIILTAFYWYLGYKVALITARVLLGNRLPKNE